MAPQNLTRHLMEIRVVAVLAVAMSSLLNLSHLSNPLEQSQLVKRLLTQFL